MTLLLIEGFDHFTSDAHLEDKGWDIGLGGAFIDIDSSHARFGGNGLQIINSAAANYVRKNIGVNKSTIYFGIAVKVDEATPIGYTASDNAMLTFLDESSVVQVEFFVNSAYGISAYQGDSTLLGSTSDQVVPLQKWCYLEGKITISATVGEVTLRINETQVLNLTSQDTKNGSDYIRYIQLASIYNDITTLFDDMYIDDAEFHGDCRVKTFLPDSVSTTNNSFTASAGNKDECVDDNPPTDDTDYIYSDTLNHKQGFGITTGSLGTVKGIQLNNFTKIDQAGTRKITPFIRSNGTDYDGTETAEITSDYKFEHECWDDDPDDSNPWTQTKLEAAEFGLEITT
jgi:hypothetical protein